MILFLSPQTLLVCVSANRWWYHCSSEIRSKQSKAKQQENLNSVNSTHLNQGSMIQFGRAIIHWETIAIEEATWNKYHLLCVIKRNHLIKIEFFFFKVTKLPNMVRLPLKWWVCVCHTEPMFHCIAIHWFFLPLLLAVAIKMDPTSQHFQAWFALKMPCNHN